MIELIFYALLAGVILYRLRLVLGRKDFSEPVTKRQKIEIPGIIEAKEKTEIQEINQLQERKAIPEEDIVFAAASVNGTFEQIKKYDRNFSGRMFAEGAKYAFEMILEAFSKGDKETLKTLLDDEVYAGFARTIDERSKANTYETKLVAIDKFDVLEASIDGSVAKVKVKYVSEQIDFTKDSEGRIIEGSPSDINVVTDIWVFEKNIKSLDPNWKLIETDRE